METKNENKRKAPIRIGSEAFTKLPAAKQQEMIKRRDERLKEIEKIAKSDVQGADLPETSYNSKVARTMRAISETTKIFRAKKISKMLLGKALYDSYRDAIKKALETL